jgi:hypothetical protein
MQNIAELIVLTRVTAELPNDLRIETETFQEGWSFVRSGDVHRLDKAIRGCGWHFVWIAEPSQRGGVGQTEQAAIASALKLALRRVSPKFNAANIDSIEITRYPWFFIAKVKLYPYQIQESAVIQIVDRAMPLPSISRMKTIPLQKSVAAPVA